jgi:putative addiction module component (TIGR02574 family)
MTIEAITSAALALPPESRAVLAETLLASPDLWDSIKYRAEWEQEIEDRIDAYERGELKAIPLEEVMRSLGNPPHEG